MVAGLGVGAETYSAGEAATSMVRGDNKGMSDAVNEQKNRSSQLEGEFFQGFSRPRA